MGKKRHTLMDRARDELFSHVVRCNVLEAPMNERLSWLDETMDYMAHRYPQTTPQQLDELERVGQRFVQPAIPHGRDTNATNRTDWQSLPVAV